MNYELKTAQIVRFEQFAQGGASIMVQNASISCNFCQFFVIFCNFCKFFTIFCNFFTQLARLVAHVLTFSHRIIFAAIASGMPKIHL